MDRAGFIAAVENLLGSKGYPDPTDAEVLILEDTCLRIEFYSENEMGIFNSEGWPCCLAMIGENPKHSMDASTVSTWELAFSTIEFGHERSLARFKQYEAYLLSAIETCKTLIKTQVIYKIGSHHQRPSVEIFLRDVPDIRLCRLEVSSTGYVFVHQPYTDHEDGVNRWFNSASAHLPESGTYIVEAFDGVVRDDRIVAALLQCENVSCKRVDVEIQKSSPNVPDQTVKAYQELMATEHHTFLEFTVQ